MGKLQAKQLALMERRVKTARLWRLGYTLQQIADELGTVRDMVSRRLKLHELQDLVRLKRGQVEVLDLKRLSRAGAPAG